MECGYWQLATDGESNKERGPIGWEDYEWAEAGVRKEGKNERERGRGSCWLSPPSLAAAMGRAAGQRVGWVSYKGQTVRQGKGAKPLPKMRAVLDKLRSALCPLTATTQVALAVAL